jgi:hypothetical protein
MLELILFILFKSTTRSVDFETANRTANPNDELKVNLLIYYFKLYFK